LHGALDGLQTDRVGSLVVAYEPVWAIGTGRAATPEQANDVIGFIRATLGAILSSGTADQIRIQYGGSVTADNFASIISQPEIDGALVGGASLNAQAFGAIVRQAAE
jgi:triosephosphate isomerase